MNVSFYVPILKWPEDPNSESGITMATTHYSDPNSIYAEYPEAVGHMRLEGDVPTKAQFELAQGLDPSPTEVEKLRSELAAAKRRINDEEGVNELLAEERDRLLAECRNLAASEAGLRNSVRAILGHLMIGDRDDLSRETIFEQCLEASKALEQAPSQFAKGYEDLRKAMRQVIEQSGRGQKGALISREAYERMWQAYDNLFEVTGEVDQTPPTVGLVTYWKSKAQRLQMRLEQATKWAKSAKDDLSNAWDALEESIKQ